MSQVFSRFCYGIFANLINDSGFIIGHLELILMIPNLFDSAFQDFMNLRKNRMSQKHFIYQICFEIIFAGLLEPTNMILPDMLCKLVAETKTPHT